MARPQFEPTGEQRKLVADLAALGIGHEDIAAVLPGGGIDPKTLRKAFREELDYGAAATRVRVQTRLHGLIDQGNLGAICFFLKCQAGWREVQRIEQTGLDGAPLPAPVAQLFLPQKDVLPELAQNPYEAPYRPPPPPLEAIQPHAPAPQPQPLPEPIAPAPIAAGNARPSGRYYPASASPHFRQRNPT